MNETIRQDLFKSNVEALIGEAFGDVKGIFLDRGTSLLETVAPISAAEASRPTVESGSTIAGHVAHVRFYLRVNKGYMEDAVQEKIDWRDSWRVHEVSDTEWEDLKRGLADDCADFQRYVASITEWNDLRVGGAMAAAAHTAFHLGAIRQMLLVIKAA